MVLYLISFYCGTSAAPRDLQHVPKLFTKKQLLANQEEHKVWVHVALAGGLQLYAKHLP